MITGNCWSLSQNGIQAQSERPNQGDENQFM